MPKSETEAAFAPPVLLLLFNRADLTQQLIDRLAEVRPPQIFIAIDGPRHGVESDPERCRAVRNVAESISWPCETHWLIRDENLGCGRASAEAISWFFDHVEAGVILEDDIHPHPDFFAFTREMLTRYAADTRIGSILGFSLLPPNFQMEAPYFCSRKTTSWGLATWRNRWAQFDFDLRHCSREEWAEIIASAYASPLERHFWLGILTVILTENPNLWAYRFQLECLRHDWLAITPRHSLVENAGFHADATNTRHNGALGRYRARPLPPPYPEIPVEVNADLDDFSFAMELLSAPQFAEHVVEAASPRYREMRVILEKQLSITQSQHKFIDRLKQKRESQRTTIAALQTEIIGLKSEHARLRDEIADYRNRPSRAILERFLNRK